MQDERIVTKGWLEHDLRALGVREEQVVMLHASVKAVGWVVGGPDTVLRALLGILTPQGTLMMLASWEDNPYDLERWPEAKRQAYLTGCPAFDPATSRADHREMGVLTEYMRTWPGAVRSTHPLSSYVAVGKQAERLLRPIPTVTLSAPTRRSPGSARCAVRCCSLARSART